MKLAHLLACAVTCLLMVSAAARADEAAPTGPVILTVSGEIGNSNRGPVDPFSDRFAAFHDLKFDRAYAFDREALRALGRHEVTLKRPDWPAAHRFSGPLLADVLDAAGAQGARVHALALDGYAADLDRAEIARQGALLALDMDGRPLGIGDLGPAWIVLPPDPATGALSEDDAAWVWGVWHIRVGG